MYIPQEIARYYWDSLRNDATPEMLTEHFLKPVTEAAQAKGWKVMAAPFYNQNLETPEKLQSFFEELFAAGFKPDIIAVQDGIGASNPDYTPHAEIETVGNYERALAQACKSIIKRRNAKTSPRPSDRKQAPLKYYKPDGARAQPDQRVKKYRR